MDTTFEILGSTALVVDGRRYEDWGRPKERAVLATLLVHAGSWVSYDKLLAWAWPEDTPLPQNPAATFHGYAHRIRQWLRRLPGQPDLRPGNGGYRLDVDKSSIDFYRFRELITEARAHASRGEPQQAETAAKQALQLWRGRPLDDLTSEPASAWRTRVVRDEWIPAHVILLEALVDIRRFDDALARLNDLQTEHPHDVRLATLRLSTLYGLKQYSEAAGYFLSTRRWLRNDGDQPAADHLQLQYEQLLPQSRESGRVLQLEPVVTPRQLPHDIPDFVGRDDLLAALDATTTTRSGQAGSGVVILDGMAGVGKTALAVHWAHANRHRFPDGDLYANLNGFADEAKVPAAAVVDDFLIALGYSPDRTMSSRSKAHLLTRHLANRNMLVLLDNVANTAHVRDLIPILSSCFILVTSRQRLSTLSAATGARRVRVEPMTQVEAVELMTIELRQHRQIDRDHIASIAPLCGGLPLAINVLADHICARPNLHLSTFSHLGRRQFITTIGDAGDGPTSIQTFFTWSYNALTAPARRLFRLVGLHPGPDISFDAVCALDGRADGETASSLNVLVGAHLIEQPEAIDRYRFHDLLGEFATHRAESDESHDTRRAAERRLLGFYLATARAAATTLYPSHPSAPPIASDQPMCPSTFPGPTQAESWLDRERANLTAATQYAATHGHNDYAWRLADPAGTFFDRRGYYEDCRTIRSVAVSAAQADGHRDAEASSLIGLGMVEMVLGNHVRARQHLDMALRIVEQDGNERGQASALHQLGRLETVRGNPAAALDLYRRGIELSRQIHDDEGLCWGNCRLGEVLQMVEQHDQALLHLHQAQWLAQRIGDKSAHANSLLEIGVIHHERGDYLMAVACCEQALGIAEAIPDFAITAQACMSLAKINSARGAGAVAAEHARRAVEICQRTHNVTDEARAYEMLGKVRYENGHVHDAVLAWQNAASLYERTGGTTQAALIHARVEAIPLGSIQLPTARNESAIPSCPPPGATHGHGNMSASS